MLGVDGVYPLGKSRNRPVHIAVDLDTGQQVAIGKVDESNPQAVARRLEPLVNRLGVGVIVTDDLLSYRVVAKKLELEHQICQFHVRRWVGRTLYELRETVTFFGLIYWRGSSVGKAEDLSRGQVPPSPLLH